MWKMQLSSDLSGTGKEVGATLGVNPAFYQGFFLAPTVVAGALKGAIFAANIYETLGFDVSPSGSESRHDIIQAVTFHVPEGVIEFCKGIQAAAPVDSFVEPEPWAMRDMTVKSLWQRELSSRVLQLNFQQMDRLNHRIPYIFKEVLLGRTQNLEF